MRSIYLLSSLVVAAALSWAGWAWLGRPVEMVAVPGGRLQCMSYTASLDGLSPLDKDFVAPPGLMERDLDLLKPYTNCIRTYSSLGSQGDAVAAASQAGVKVLLGIWISSNDKTNQKEIDRAMEIAETYPDAIRAIVVGNEVLLRREMTGERLAGIIRSVKARTRHPVTYADIVEFWRRHPVVAEAVDIMTVHVLPYWDDPAPVSIDAVQAHVRTIIETVREYFPGKAMQIGEIGWPSAGRSRAEAAPTLVNEARFVREFAAQAESLGLPYNLIEAMDQPWKRAPEGTVGGFWGLFDKNRNLKFPLSGPVNEWPEWRTAAGFTAAVAALGLVWVFVARPAARVRQWALATLVGTAAGGTLWALADLVRSMALGFPGWIWGGFLIALAGGGAVLLVRLAAGDAASLPPPSSLDSTLAGLRRREWPDAAMALGLFRWAVLIPGAVVVLALAVDGRHRDFLTLAYWMPAAVFAVLSLRQPPPGRPEIDEGWLGILLVLGGLGAIDSFGNREALVWAVCCLTLAFPLRASMRAEIRRLAELLGTPGQEEAHGHHGNG